jgi:hypothetical protein
VAVDENSPAGLNAGIFDQFNTRPNAYSHKHGIARDHFSSVQGGKANIVGIISVFL